MDESSPVETYAVHELIDILINRGKESNGFEFVTAKQISDLLAEWHKEAPLSELLKI